MVKSQYSTPHQTSRTTGQGGSSFSKKCFDFSVSVFVFVLSWFHMLHLSDLSCPGKELVASGTMWQPLNAACLVTIASDRLKKMLHLLACP